MYLTLVGRVDNSPYTQDIEIWRFLSHDGVTLGKMIESVVDQLLDVEWLIIDKNLKIVRVKDPHNLSDKFAELAAYWRKVKMFECLAGWRDELYTCYTSGGIKYFVIERSAAALFGLVSYGCHITGYCPASKEIWVPRRSYSKPTYPGMLDNTVAGGLGNNLDFKECAIKECAEEAGLSRDYVIPRLISCGVVTYEFIDPETKYFQPEVECIYDLKMEPPSEGGVTPQPEDGEAQDFRLMSYEEVKKRMFAGEFKYNCALVLVDFFIRHGEITVENEAEYFEIVARCHRRLEYPLRKSFNKS